MQKNKLEDAPQELKILQKTYDMIEFAYPAIAQFPKSEKYALGTDIKRCMHTFLELAIEAQKKYHKKTTLQNLDITLAKLRAFVRLAHALGFLATKRYEAWSAKNVELGKMVGGWIKSQIDKS